MTPRSRIFTAFILSLGILGCASGHQEYPQRTVEPVPPETTPYTIDTRAAAESWTVGAIRGYLERSNSPLISGARSRGQELSWIIDRTETADSAVYTVVHIGHDEMEPDGSNPRFATDGWIYLDTLHRRIYEYDVAADSLLYWAK